VKDGQIRIDKWLWFVRVVKTRTLAARLVQSGAVRVNKVKVTSAAHGLKVGDVATVAVAGRVRVLKVAGLGERRGPAAEAALLYEEIGTAPADGGVGTAGAPASEAAAPAVPAVDPAPAVVHGGGRPTKKDRRRFERDGSQE